MTIPDAFISRGQDWPAGGLADLPGDSLLERFAWRMGRHGMSVSVRLMRADPAYAVQQMDHARQLGDDELTAMSLALFADFQRARSGVASLH